MADLGRGRADVTYFGVEDDSQALPGMQHAADSKHCRNCGHAYIYEAVYLGHLGRYRCPNCGRRRPTMQVAATAVELDGMRGSRVSLRTPAGELDLALPLPGLYNVYNAVAAVATALELGVPLATVGQSLEGFGGAFGRVETIPIEGRKVSILLIKNPAGANEVLRTLTLEEGRHDLWCPQHGSPTAATSRDLGRRLRGAGRPRAQRHLHRHARRGDGAAAEVRGHRRLLDTDRDIAARSTAPCAALPARACTRCHYTALLELRDLLARRGLATVVGVSDVIVWMTSRTAATPPTCRSGANWRRSPRPGPRLGAGTGRVLSTSPRPGTT